MKKTLLWLLFIGLFLPMSLSAENFVNLTPRAKQMTVGDGELTLPSSFVVSHSGLTDEMKAEVEKFITALSQTTGYDGIQAQEDAAEALFFVKKASVSSKDEAYKVVVTTEKVTIEAATPVGLFYAFQTIKKILPPNVMAGVKEAGATYKLPVVSITDEPRFAYRGFMLDVARHFFTVEEVKRMIDVMAYYKMNRFHWHLSDDQGWRVEIKKYPKLTTVGSIAPNSRFTDMKYGHYWINRPYGPYFYTQEELKDVVAYAKEKHIEVIPEIDMPGHFVAAMTAYPEYSCYPNGSHQVWIDGGISSDVLNVANPAAVQFAKDILAELIDIFPYEQIHIGGDECPTSAWEANAECQARYKELGLTSYRQLQSLFIKEISDFVQERGRKISVWNEAISAGGADTDLIKATAATVYCWTGPEAACKKAANLGLDNIYTPWGPYYINRKQSTDPNEPPGAGDGTDNVKKTYNTVPVPGDVTTAQAKYYTGVQGTFWCEHVSDRVYMEYLALPRLIAVAEAGWTPQSLKNFEHFQKRITADSTLLNYNGYNYSRDFMTAQTSSSENVMPEVSTADKKYWYHIVTRATDETRIGRCFELLREGAPTISEYSSKGAAAGVLWALPQVDEKNEAYDYQLWAFEEDAANPGHYALVCKAQPNGSVNPTPTAVSTSGRWKYDATKKHYNFVLGDNGYGKHDGNYYYTLRSDKVNGQWMNASMAGQGHAVNLYSDPASGNGGLWTFVPLQAVSGYESALALLNEVNTYLTYAKTYASEAEKRPGLFGEAETNALRSIVKDVDLMTMSAEELTAFSEQLNTAYKNFRASFAYLEKGKAYSFVNSSEGFIGLTIHDSNEGSYLRHTTETWSDNAWEVTASTVNADFTQSVQLKNKGTGRFMGQAATAMSGKVAYPVSVAQSGSNLVCHFNIKEGDFEISSSGKNLYPIPVNSITLPGIISSGSSVEGANAFRLVGSAWAVQPVYVMTYVCTDEAGNALGTFRQSATAGVPYRCEAPSIKNHSAVSYNGEAEAPLFDALSEDQTINVVYKRSSYAINIVSRDQRGALIASEETACPVGESYTVALPEHEFYTFSEADQTDGAKLTLEKDLTINAVYSTNAYNGVKKLGKAVTKVTDGHSYVIYDTSPVDTERIGYRNVTQGDLLVMKVDNIEGRDPYHTWLLEKSGSGFKVKNEYVGLYVPQLTTAAKAVSLVKNGGVYNFSLNADGETWKIKGSNGVCWDGLGSGALVGWNDPGHPYKLYEYYADPYFTVTIKSVDTDENELAEAIVTLVRAGESYMLTTTTIEGYTVKEFSGDNDKLGRVSDHLTVSVVYEKEGSTGIEEIATEQKQNSIYDLSGRRIHRIARGGIYIVNGKKVLVK